jgi:hypothetical protein
MKKALSLILAAALVLVGVPGGAQGFGPNTVWGVAPETAAVNALLLDGTGLTVATIPVVNGKFAFRDIAPGRYTVSLQTGTGQELARSLPVDLASGLEVEALFGRNLAAAAVPVAAGGGVSTTAWIVMGALAVGITTAVVIAQNDDDTNVASPSR